jgi:Family of unknown function (DUF5677)
MTPHELAQQSLDLLNQILEETRQLYGEKNFRLGFIYKHTQNIFDLGEDVLALELQNRSSSSRIVVRSMIESLFKLAAAIRNPSFAAEKAIAEIDDEIERIGKWLEVEHENKFSTDMDETLKLLSKTGQNLRSENNVTTKNKWTVYDTAKVAELDSFYVQYYFIFSKYVHSTLSGVISQEYQTGRGNVVNILIFILLATAASAVHVFKTVAPQKHLDEIKRLTEIGADLHNNGDFKNE